MARRLGSGGGPVIARNRGETDAHYRARLADVENRRTRRGVTAARAALTEDGDATAALAVLRTAAARIVADLNERTTS